MMKNLIIIIVYLISFQLQANQNSEYTLASGDKIRILVYDEPDLTVEAPKNVERVEAYGYLELITWFFYYKRLRERS